MSYGSLRQRTQEAAQPAAADTGCYASHCPCLGSASVEGGKFMCAAHLNTQADAWPRITEKLHEHDWLIAFIGDMRRMERKYEDWRGFAAQFWTGQDERCQPDPAESFGAYEYRMRAELMYRAGVARMPSVRRPKPITKRGNAAAYLAKEAA